MITEMEISVLPMPDYKVGAEISTSFEYKQKLNPYEKAYLIQLMRNLNKDI